MNKEKLKQIGADFGFNAAVYNNPTDPTNRQKASVVSEAFVDFAETCLEQGLSMASGIEEFEGIGMCGYLAIKTEDDILLFAALTPHDLVDVEEDNDAEE